MAHDKLNEDDEGALAVPQGAMLLSSGVNGAETFIERDKTATVRLVITTVAVSTHGAGTLDAVIEVGGDAARAQDGPMSPDDHHRHLRSTVSVQVVAKEGERLKLKAYPEPQGARVLKTVVYATEVKSG